MTTQGFLNKLKQKSTPSNQPQEICNLPTFFRIALLFVNCLCWTALPVNNRAYFVEFTILNSYRELVGSLLSHTHALGISLATWPITAEFNLCHFHILTYRVSSGLSVSDSLSVWLLGCNSLATLLLHGFSVYSALGALPSWQSSEGLLKNDWLM